MAIAPCAPTTPVRGVVVFEPALFAAAFPMFATVPALALQVNFDQATLVLNNNCGSRVQDAALRERLLSLLTAHITALTNGVNGTPPSGLVGRVDRAQQGSVSVSASMGEVTNSQAWFAQTQWGALFWQATARFRTMTYFGPPACCPGGIISPGAGFGPVGTGYPGYNGGTS